MTNPWVEWKTTWLNENSMVYIISKVWMKKKWLTKNSIVSNEELNLDEALNDLDEISMVYMENYMVWKQTQRFD